MPMLLPWLLSWRTSCQNGLWLQFANVILCESNATSKIEAHVIYYLYFLFLVIHSSCIFMRALTYWELQKKKNQTGCSAQTSQKQDLVLPLVLWITPTGAGENLPCGSSRSFWDARRVVPDTFSPRAKLSHFPFCFPGTLKAELSSLLPSERF